MLKVNFVPFDSRLPAWMRSYIPKIFYVEEKAWNYYPYTITGKAWVVMLL